MWGLLKRHASPPHQPSAFSPLPHASQLGVAPGAARPPHLTPHIPRHTPGATRPTHASRIRYCSLAADERINWDDFSQIAEEMPQRAAESYFSAKHFVLFELDAYGRIPIVHFFQWAMRKNELMRTRRRLSVPSWWWCYSPLCSGSPGAGSPGCWLRCALGTSRRAAQGPMEGLRCGGKARPKSMIPRRWTRRHACGARAVRQRRRRLVDGKRPAAVRRGPAPQAAGAHRVTRSLCALLQGEASCRCPPAAHRAAPRRAAPHRTAPRRTASRRAGDRCAEVLLFLGREAAGAHRDQGGPLLTNTAGAPRPAQARPLAGRSAQQLVLAAERGAGKGV